MKFKQFNALATSSKTAMLAWSFSALLSLVSGNVMAADAPRIISTDAGTTEVLIALGQGENLVGIDVTSSVPQQFSPAQVGYHRNLAAEGLLSLQPTVLFGGEHIGPIETVEALQATHTQLVLQPSATNPKELSENVAQVAAALNVSDEQIQQRIDDAVQHLAKHTSVEPAELNAAFLLHLQGRGMKQAGTGTAGDAFVSLLGLNNSSDHQSYRAVSAEGLMAIQPDVILIASQNPEAAQELLKQFPMLSHTPAANKKRILYVDASAIVSGISLKALDEAVRISESL